MDSFEMLLRASSAATTEDMNLSVAEHKEEMDAIRGILSLAGKVTMDDIESFCPQPQPYYRRPRAMSEPWNYSDYDIFPKTLVRPADMGAYEDGVFDKEDDEDIEDEDGQHGDANVNVRKEYADIYNKNGRIGIYTKEERALIIQRYRAKKSRRNWKKQVRYSCRKNLADRRVRIKGRFIKAEDLEKMGLNMDGTPKESAESEIPSTKVPESSNSNRTSTPTTNVKDKVKQELSSILDNMNHDGELLRPGKRIRRHSIAY